MAQAMASMTGLEGSFLQISGSSRLITSTSARVSLLAKPGFTVRSQSSEAETSRRAVLGLVAGGLATGSFVQAVFAGAKSIQIGGPPPPSGGLPGTLNADEARDFELPLNKRFFLQPLPPTEAAARAKESAKDILNVKPLIEKKAWPYVQNDLRNKAGYLRFDLNTVISAKPKDEKIALKELYTKLFKTISQLDHAAKTKDSPSAEKYYAETVSALNDVLAKLG